MALLDTTLPIGYGTDISPDAGKQVITAEDGTIIVLNKYGSTVYSASIEIPFATRTELNIVQTFFENNKNSPWTFQHPGDGETYSLYFLNEPKVKRLETHGNPTYEITISAVGYRL